MSMEQELDKSALEAAKPHMGNVAWPTVLLGCSVTIAYVAAPFLVAAGHIPLLLAMPLMIFLTYAAYTVTHEAVHGSISGAHRKLRWLNELLGYMGAFILAIPLTAHRHEHLAHHRHTNDEQEDPDFVVSTMGSSPFNAVRCALRVVAAQYTYYLRHRWHADKGSQNLAFCSEIAAAVLGRLLIIYLTAPLESSLLFVVGGVGGIALLMYLFAYIVHTPHEAVGRYVDTATILVPGPLGRAATWLWGFQNYHSIHHLFPRVPFYRYRDIFEDIEPIMERRGAPIYRLGLGGLQTAQAQVPVAR